MADDDVLERAERQIDTALIKVLLPQLYEVVDALLASKGEPSKELVTKAKRLLPAQYSQSFQHK